MSKDKGQKNHKKSPADKSSGKTKAGSSYKQEGKLLDKPMGIDVFAPKTGKPGTVHKM
ncbi:MAG: hypothetical protein IPH94_04965 [Saprospiraceae bacterium]|nr:hypothetical protein [Saprospiraceae bacterium]MBK7220704.1 hypothetical protein [Saprospiraceae bacterium]MBK7790658.1 hypothetical protein [Saprospiraceae bacterium]MBK8111454.1 hypothetical protein [Saprospiraceae bacterium]MBK8848774.1 hypothetical protein [Saprospiraceae bacterium]